MEAISISGQLIRQRLLNHRIAGYRDEQQPYVMAKWFARKVHGWEDLEFSEMIAADSVNVMGDIKVSKRRL